MTANMADVEEGSVGNASGGMSLAEQLASLRNRAEVCETRLGISLERALRGLLGGLDVDKCGTGAAKTLEEIIGEITGGSAQLMLKEVTVGRCVPVRVVDTVLLRLNSQQDGGKVLIETGQQYADGRKRETCRLPGTKRELNEPPEETIKRIQRDVLQRNYCPMNISFEAVDFESEEKDTETVPGLRTFYRKRIIKGHITSMDPQHLADLGLTPGSDGTWSVEPSVGRSTGSSFAWLDEEEATRRGVKLTGDGLGGLSLPLLIPLSHVLNSNLRGGGSGSSSSKSTGNADNAGSESTLHRPLISSVTDFHRRLDTILQKDKKVLDLEHNLSLLEPWMQSEHASIPSMMAHERMKRQYLVQQADGLQDFRRALAEVERLRACINPPSLQDLSSHCERLQRLEARHAVAAKVAARLHDQVAKVAEDYHQATLTVNAQLLSWDGILSGTH